MLDQNKTSIWILGNLQRLSSKEKNYFLIWGPQESKVCVFFKGGAALTHHWAVLLHIQVKTMLTFAVVKCRFVYQQLPSLMSSYLPEDQTHALSPTAETPGFWSKLIPSWRTTVMNGLGESDGWAPTSSTQPSAPRSKYAGACPTFVEGRMRLCTVAQGTLHVGLRGLLC